MPALTPGVLTCITIPGQDGALDSIIIHDGFIWVLAITIPGAGADGGVHQYTVLLIAGRPTMADTGMDIMATAITGAGTLLL
jgi:hypothetical protein